MANMSFFLIECCFFAVYVCSRLMFFTFLRIAKLHIEKFIVISVPFKREKSAKLCLADSQLKFNGA